MEIQIIDGAFFDGHGDEDAFETQNSYKPPSRQTSKRMAFIDTAHGSVIPEHCSMAL